MDNKNYAIQKIYDRFYNDPAGFTYSLTDIFKEKDGTYQKLYPLQISFLNESKQNELITVVVKCRQCLTGDSMIYTTEGPKPIKQLIEENYRGNVYTYDDDNNLVVDKILDGWNSGKKNVYEIKLASGERIKASKDHKIKTSTGWKKVFELAKGDLINIFEGEFCDYKIDKAEPILMGYFITDGSYTNSTPQFTNINKNYLNEFEANVKDRFDVQTRWHEKGNGFDLKIIGNKKHTNKSNEYSKYLTSLNLRGIKSENKILPNKFLNLNKEDTINLLNRIFAGDGWYSSCGTGTTVKRKCAEVGLGSPCLQFLHQVSFLLSKFGIHCNINEANSGKKQKNKFYKLKFSSLEYVNKFVNEIGIYDKKPRIEREPTRNLRKQKNRIVSIKEIGEEETYDLTTEKYHSYIANGIHVHNSGFSTSIKSKALHNAYFGKVPNILIASASQLQATKVLREIKEAIYSMPEFLRPEFSKETEQEIHFKSGTKLISLSTNPQTARGFSGEVFWDEASLFNRKDSTKFFESILPSTSKGYAMTIVSTPLGKDNIFYDLCNPKYDEDGEIDGIRADKIIKVHYSQVPHIKKYVEEKDLIKKMPHKSFLQEYCCEFLDDNEDSLFTVELLDGKFFDNGLEFLDLSQINTIEGPEISSDLILSNLKTLYDHIYVGFDPAITAAKDGDGSMVVVFGVKNDEWQLLFIRKLPKGMEVGPQCDYVARLAKIVKADKVGFDSTGGLGLAFQSRLKETPISNILCPIVFSTSLKTQEFTEIKNKMETHKMKSPTNQEIKKQFSNLGYNPITGRIAAMGSWRSNKDDICAAILCAHACRSKKNNSGFSIIRVR